MSNHDVTHSCGHEKTIKLEGKNVRSEHERKAEWLAKQPCDDCQLVARVKTARNGQTDKDQRLVPLTSGSDKQVAWALDIRTATINAIDKDLVPRVERQKKNTTLEEAQRMDQLLAIVNQIVTECDAKWWIDNRSYDGAVSLRKLRKIAIDRMDHS